MNPMELYHNQVTRVQGRFHCACSSFLGLMMIQSNISAPSTCWTFRRWSASPTRSANMSTTSSDHSIVMNVGKVKKMCELIRQYRPGCRIVIGGHIANLPVWSLMIDADFIVKGEGVNWMRRYLGEDPARPVAHPESFRLWGASWGCRCGRVRGRRRRADPSVGCPMGCNFCSTSALFGGKGNFLSTSTIPVRSCSRS